MSAVRVHGRDDRSLHPEEREAVAGRPPRRVQEFAAGREAARQALVRLGTEAFAIPRSADRLPQWPEGVLGSISHSETLAGAAVTRDGRLAGLGMDLENSTIGRLGEIAHLIMTPGERVRIESSTEPGLSNEIARAFSSKEAVFKAVYPAVREAFDFTDIEIDRTCSSGGFAARAVTPLRSSGRIRAGRGRCMLIAEHILSVFAVEARNFSDLDAVGTDKTIDGST